MNDDLPEILDPRPLQPNERVCRNRDCNIAYNRHLPVCPELACNQ